MFQDVRSFVALRGGAAAELARPPRSWDSSSAGFLYAPDNLWSAQTRSTLVAGAGTPPGAALNAMMTTGPYQSSKVLSDWVSPSCEGESDGGSVTQMVPWARCG